MTSASLAGSKKSRIFTRVPANISCVTYASSANCVCVFTGIFGDAKYSVLNNLISNSHIFMRLGIKSPIAYRLESSNFQPTNLQQISKENAIIPTKM